MELLCGNCKLRERIEEQRIILNNTIVEKEHKLLDDEIIRLSQELDDLVYKCVFCSKNLKCLSKIDLKNIFGTHSTFYYYGYQHLFTTMFLYITEGINNNECIYISMEKPMYDELLNFLKTNKASVESIKFTPVRELIMSSKNGGVNVLKEKIDNICSEVQSEKYSGIRWIGQPTYAIETTSEKDFLDWEINLSEAIKNTNVSLLCIYDFYDYMNKSKVINQKVIKESLDTHGYILLNSTLEKIK